MVQQRSGHYEHKSMNLYFYPKQGYFVVEDTTALAAKGYNADVEWSYMIDCGTSPTSYADIGGNYYTAENPGFYGLGLVWLAKDADLQWKGFSGIGALSGELRWVLPADETSNNAHYSKYAILLDGANIRADAQSLYSQLSNPPSLSLSQTAETQSVALTLTSSINSLETAVNQQSSFEITLQNNGNIEAKNIHMSSYGVPSAWVQFSEDAFSLAPNAQKRVTVTVSPAYVGDGNYSLTISATAAVGNTPSATIELKVNRAPIAEFTFVPPNASIRDMVNFTDESSSPDGQVTDWLWTFGDGASSTLRTPSHKYAQKGNFAATLMVTDDNGAKASVSHTVVIHNLSPSAAFNCTPTSPEVDTNVQFTDSSADPENLLASWHWDFGDSSTSDVQNPNHNFTSTGNFNVTLTVTDDEGATGASSKIVSVTGPSPTETPLPIPIWAIASVMVLVAGMGASIFYLRKRRH
jgi:PKD repeat protein